MQNPSVAIIILNWNTSHFLKEFLPSVVNTTYTNKEIYVVDNNSTDDSVQMVSNFFPSIHLIQMASNKGYASSYNYALSEIKSDYFILLNSDIKVTPAFIDPVIALMESNPAIAICQPKLRSLAEQETFEYAGAAGGWIDRLGYPFAKGRVLLTLERDGGQYDQVEPVFWATGACMFLKSIVYRSIGGFYDYYYMHQEDIDLCWRAQRAGFKVYTCPDSVVYHIGGGSLSWENHLKTFLTFRNNYILLTRNLTVFRAPPVILFRLIIDLMGVVYFLFQRKFGIGKAMFKAIFAYIFWLIFYPGKKNNHGKGMYGLDGVYKGTILFPYFFRNKRKFSEIISMQTKIAAT
jgi:GT2 family glycosyltransferase